MKIGGQSIVSLIVVLAATACGGSTPNSPSPVAVCAPIAAQTSMSLHAGDLFRFRFAVPSGTDADALVTLIGESGSGFSTSAATMRLFDGANLLGAVNNYQDSVAFWVSATRTTHFSPEVVVDFRTIANGAIDGRVEFMVTRGSVFIDRLDLATVALVRGSDADWIWSPAITAGAREVCH
jgi:hypothetical protein